jgi:hypothetical protein
VAHVNDPLSAAARLALCGGVTLYLAGHAAFRLRIVGTLSYAPVAAAFACLLAFALELDPAWVTAGAITLVLALLLVWETIAARGWGRRGKR